MISTFAIFLFAILNILPNNVTAFSLTMPESKPTQLVKQTDGGWKALREGEKESPVFYVKGTQLHAKGDGQDSAIDFAEAIDVMASADWKALRELKIYENEIGIERRNDGMDLIIKSKRQNKEGEERVFVRWRADAKP